MPDNMDRVGIMAEVATAAAAVAYPLVRVVSRHAERTRKRREREIAAATAAVEVRLIERCSWLEARVTHLERVGAAAADTIR